MEIIYKTEEKTTTLSQAIVEKMLGYPIVKNGLYHYDGDIIIVSGFEKSIEPTKPTLGDFISNCNSMQLTFKLVQGGDNFSNISKDELGLYSSFVQRSVTQYENGYWIMDFIGKGLNCQLTRIIVSYCESTIIENHKAIDDCSNCRFGAKCTRSGQGLICKNYRLKK